MPIVLTGIAIALVAVIGWISNIVYLIQSFTILAEVTILQILSGIGIFFGPLGIILGWLNIFGII